MYRENGYLNLKWLRNVSKVTNTTSSYFLCFYLSVITVLTGCLCLFISRDSLAFCTEPVFASLANVLGQWDNLPSPVPTDIKEYKLYDVETKYGLMQVRRFLYSWKEVLFSFELVEPQFQKSETTARTHFYLIFV